MENFRPNDARGGAGRSNSLADDREDLDGSDRERLAFPINLRAFPIARDIAATRLLDDPASGDNTLPTSRRALARRVMKKYEMKKWTRARARAMVRKRQV